MTISGLDPMKTSARLLSAALATVASIAALAIPLGAATAAAALTARAPAVPVGLPSGIERLTGYVPANSCHPTAKPGTTKLGQLLTTTYPGTRYGIDRICGVDPLPTSEHYDGRAVDWMNSIRDPQQAAQAKAVITWLFATDKAGNTYANARRLGVMYVIWNNKIWGAYSPGWRPYSSCASHPERSYDSTCHRNHMHVSLSWEGAMARTSFWSKRVAAPDFGPCRPADLNWAATYTEANPVRCPRYATVKPPVGASATLKTLTTYSGMVLRTGSKGPVVTAVQRVVGTTADGTYSTRTKAAMQAWQTRNQITASGGVNATTWRALLKSQAPKPTAALAP